MPCDGSETSTDEFTTQLSVIYDIIEQHQNCQIILGGDFMLTFLAAGLIHPYFSNYLNSPLLFPAFKHICNAVD